MSLDLHFKDLNELQKKLLGENSVVKNIPIKSPNWCFTALSIWHKFSYWRGGSEQDRYDSDEGFYEAMLKDANMYYGLKGKLYKLQAWLYFKFVRLIGKWFFNYCEKKLNINDLKKLEEKYKEIVTSFKKD